MENNKLAGISTALVDAATNPSGFYCSMPINSDDDRAKLYNALNNPSVKIADHVNQIINIKDIIVEPVEMKDVGTGNINIVPRVVFMDTEGYTYAAVSVGIYNAVRRLINIYGMPTYEQGISAKIVQLTRGANRTYSLVLV